MKATYEFAESAMSRKLKGAVFGLAILGPFLPITSTPGLAINYFFSFDGGAVTGEVELSAGQNNQAATAAFINRYPISLDLIETAPFQVIDLNTSINSFDVNAARQIISATLDNLGPVDYSLCLSTGNLAPGTVCQLTNGAEGSFLESNLGAGLVEGTDLTFTPITSTPLPAALPLFATGLGALGLLGWRRKKKAATALAA